MPPFDVMIAFFLATSVFAYMPGPAMLYTAAQTISRGRRAGLMATLGIHLGGYVHVLAAALGLSVIFHAVPVLYAALKFAGAAYLCWLGTRLFLQSKSQVMEAPSIQAKSAKRAFVESITVEVLNPKTTIFFVAFLPQFTAMSEVFPIWAQFLILGTIANVMFSSADLVCVGMAGVVMQRLRQSARAQRITERIGGGLLIALGVNLALHRD